MLEQGHEYDWIILDLFSEVDAPLFLFKHQFYAKLRAAMAKDGLLFINFLSNHPSQLKQLEHLLITEFGKRPSIEKIPNYVNHIVMITK